MFIYFLYFTLRVNGAMAQLQEFQDAFKCKSNSKMVADKLCDVF